MFDLLFLGTGASTPSRERSTPCIAVRCSTEVLVFDCGEGSQRQFMISPFSFMKISSIFITHMHGDHILGLPGLIQTMGLNGRKNPLRIFGPKGFKDTMESINNSMPGGIEYTLDIEDVSAGDRIELSCGTVTAFATSHGVESIGYVFRTNNKPGTFDKSKAISLGLSPGNEFRRLQNGETVNGVSPEEVIGPERAGPSLAYTGDTEQCDTLREACKDITVIIHESTYSDADSELAKAHFHSTSKQAAELARDSCARHLILTHISNRYGDADVLLDEARSIFGNTYLAHDMDMFTVTETDIKPA